MRSLASVALVLVALGAAVLATSSLEPADSAPTIEPASTARAEGDPARDDRLEARTSLAGEPVELRVKQTPAPLLDRLPVGQELREASPTGPDEAELRLTAGPAVREAEGSLSPRFPLQAQVLVDEDARFDRAWLRLDQQAWAELEPAGHRADQRVLLAQLAAGVLPARARTHVDVVFERRAGPEAVHWVEGPGFDVHADDRGPQPPRIATEDGQLQLGGEADAFEAQARAAGGDWRAAPVRNATIEAAADADEVRARGVDELGNTGPWTSSVDVPAEAPPEPAPGPWQLVAPEPGATVEGAVTVDWRPEGTLVEVHARAPDEPSRLIGEASQPPITWRTGFVPDGDWELHIRAHEDGSWTSRVVPVTVDNLDPAQVGQAGEDEGSAPAADVEPRTAQPWSAALATGAGLLAAIGLLARLGTRRPK
jgi:hypothetical protein